MKTQFCCLAMALVLFFSTGLARAAEGDSSAGANVSAKRLKIVAKAGLYGFGGGLVVGMASQVFHKKAKNIFMFGSLGMYAGILLGIYVISTSQGPAPYEGPDTYEDFNSQNDKTQPYELAKSESLHRSGSIASATPDLRVNFLSLKF